MQHLFLNLSKKKIVHEWKTELLREKSKNNEDALVSEILQAKETMDDIHINAGDEGPDDERKLAEIENERQAAKNRIAKWKVDRVKQMEQERVRAIPLVCVL